MLVEPNVTEVSVLLPAAPPKEMISVTQLADGRTKVRINSSSISVIQECLRKSQYLLEEQWRPEVEGPGLTFGSAIHRAMEVYYSAAPERRILPSFDSCEPIAYGHRPAEPLLVHEAMIAFVEKAKPLAGLPDGDKRSLANGIWLLHEYFRTYIDDPYVTYVDKDGPFIERTYKMLLYENSELVIETFGTIDFAFQSTVDGSILLGDHKTAASLGFGGQSYYDRDRPSQQYCGYLLAGRTVFGIDSYEFMVNIFSVAAKPKTARGKGPDFPRQITRRDEDDFEEYRDLVYKAVKDYLYARESGKWPLGAISACTSYGACTYKQVCGSPKSLRDNILRAKFVRPV